MKCPYNAIRVCGDIEDGFPVFDRVKCEACGRCFNKCPTEAIEMSAFHTELRSRYPKPMTLPEGERTSNGGIAVGYPGKLGMGRRVILGYERRIGVVLVIVVLVIAMWLKR
jgi:hypothetical protein